MNTDTTKVWLVTGATRGLGAALVQELLDAGERVVATGRNVSSLRENFGIDTDRLLSLPLDVTDEPQVREAVAAALERFGRIDVLVNNAGYGQLGLFEEITGDAIERQYATNVFGAFHVMRAVLPTMRKQREGRILNISSVGGMRGGPGGGVYCSSKFALEGLSESLAGEVKDFGIHVTIIEPGFFRTDFLDSNSVDFGQTSISEYEILSNRLRAYYEDRNHKQAGDPQKLGRVLIRLSRVEDPPIRFAAGSDAVELIAAKVQQVKNDLEEWHDLSVSTDGEYQDAVLPTAR